MLIRSKESIFEKISNGNGGGFEGSHEIERSKI